MKTKILKIKSTSKDPVILNGSPLEEVQSFIYLGSIFDQQGGTETDVKARIGKTRAAFIQLKNIWNSRDLSLATKIHEIQIQHKPLKMHCSSCALVTSSGHLTGGGRGKEIDQAECVIRMNDAPTARGYGLDVGHRTSLRVIAHSSMQRVLRSRHELLNSSQDTVFIFWGPSSYMRRDGKGLVYNNLRLMNQVLPKLKVYIISWQKMLQFDELFKRETGKDRRISNSWLSTGWFTMTIALELCDRINVYGMVPPDFCRESQHPSVPYHYYEPTGPDECAMYISHERGRRGSHHRFITEKRVFASWARTFNIHFYQPDWSPPPLSRNSTATTAFTRSQKM
ncbi:alpha-N-acetylgalactosaminide alpha-2,6-sialyltransferase 5-like [Sinocyclocheilus anshuiensis]|uniref:alpha-N-acetylgalactosaminide alpha-2,6-sialyltransferase 5-like n=1 Tax=Sinocyclocheilus anshuiensis TaxID=1608454 RepID=UPI0007B893FC|nr:PREDICTED: alpha-N-acetylgalactosaminide alpha-2,6-sialyltransferase 5-like [Sinocyclocheilus anshuiensis]